MLMNTLTKCVMIKIPVCLNCRLAALQRCHFSQNLEDKYTEPQKEKILKIINNSESNNLAGYDINKSMLKKFSQWKMASGTVKSLSDVEIIDGFTRKTAVKLFNSILNGPQLKADNGLNRIKGQILHPNLSKAVRQDCKMVEAIYVSVNSVCWALIDEDNYEVVKWQYQPIDYQDGKKLLITDIFNVAWAVTRQLSTADIYVMKAEPTTLRAAGSDPNNPKLISVNLQKAQLVAMIVALINARHQNDGSFDVETPDQQNDLVQKIYFLRPTLPFRLYGTLVGNEKVSTEQTVEMLLQESNTRSTDNSHVYVPKYLQDKFRAQKDLQKDMLGHCLLLGLTFMDLCVYRNEASIQKLNKRN